MEEKLGSSKFYHRFIRYHYYSSKKWLQYFCPRIRAADPRRGFLRGFGFWSARIRADPRPRSPLCPNCIWPNYWYVFQGWYTNYHLLNRSGCNNFNCWQDLLPYSKFPRNRFRFWKNFFFWKVLFFKDFWQKVYF